MDSQKITKEFRMAKWKQIIRERGESGESIKDFCNRVGVTKNSYMYWQRKIREAACRQLASITDNAIFPFFLASMLTISAAGNLLNSGQVVIARFVIEIVTQVP
jgi:hypothetical protein